MLIAAVLVTVHLLALLTCIVFLAGRSALLRPEVGEARRSFGPLLRRLDRIYWAALLTLGASGILLILFGPYGPAYYGRNILLVLMAAGWLALLLQAAFATHRLGKIMDGAIGTDEAAFERSRSSLMAEGHLFGLIVIFGAFLAMGYGRL